MKSNNFGLQREPWRCPADAMEMPCRCNGDALQMQWRCPADACNSDLAKANTEVDVYKALATTSIFIIAGGSCVGRGHIGRRLILVQVIGTIFLCTIVLVVRTRRCFGGRTVKATIIHVEIMPPIKTSPIVAIENINVVPSIPGIPPIAPPPAAPQPIAPVK